MPGTDSRTSVRASVEVALEPASAFDAVLDGLMTGLSRDGVSFQIGPDGLVEEDGRELGRVVSWAPGEELVLEWRPADWAPDEVTRIALRCEATAGGSRVVLEHKGWGALVGEPTDLAGWFGGEVASPLLRAVTPRGFGDWLTDRRARRPSGAEARATYRDPLYHRPNFRVILEELALSPADTLLEVGRGGGALLHDALASGCRARAVDHSAEMLAVARSLNSAAIEEGRLDLRLADAARLPFPDETFTCATMTGVLGFLRDPVAVLREIRRVLVPGGRFVGLGSDPELRGTPAAPEPMASRLRFYESEELEGLARDAGFSEVTVLRRNLEGYAREVGVLEEHLALFAGSDARFLLARRG
jgi:SAM-dependent methyltransferase